MHSRQVGITAIASAIPEARQDNISHGAGLNFAEDFIRNKVGFTSVAKASGDHRTSDLALAALSALLAKTGRQATDVDCLIVCTQNPDGTGLPNTASTVHGEAGLARNCSAFDISLGCSGYVYGLSVARSFMEANGLRCGVLITSDPYSKIIAPEDRDTVLLFGDAATATLLEPGAAWQLGQAVFGSDGTLREAISTDETGGLTMNGRAVFVFSAQTVPGAIQDALARNEMALDDIDLILAHQGSRYIIEELRRRLGVDADKLPFEASEIGNTVSSSIPLMLEKVLTIDAGSGAGDASRNILLAGFGVGLSWGVTLLKYRP